MKLALGLAILALGACGTDDTTTHNTSLTREIGACGDVETHVFGEMAPDDDLGQSGGSAETPTIVTIQRPGKHVVVVSAVGSVHWQVKAENGAEIEKVYAVGIAKQYVTAPAGVPIIEDSDDDGTVSACGYAWPATADCDTSSLLYLASVRTKFHPTSFHGCAKATRWTLGPDLAVTSDCDPAGVMPASAQSDLIARCEPTDGGPSDECEGTIY